MLIVSQANAQSPDREILVQGFRSPSMGVEVKDGFLGFSVGVYPTTIDENSRGEPRTTWFLKTGLTAYVYDFDTGSGRPSSPFVSLALVQGLNNAWNVSDSIREGSGVFVDLGFRWAAYRGLDLRMGAGLLVGWAAGGTCGRPRASDGRLLPRDLRGRPLPSILEPTPSFVPLGTPTV